MVSFVEDHEDECRMEKSSENISNVRVNRNCALV
jgi:hypothetical protein